MLPSSPKPRVATPATGSAARCSLARDRDENLSLEDVYELQRRLGLPAARLSSKECRALEPSLAPAIRGGILVAGDHQVDNRALLQALLIACTRAGVGVVRARARLAASGDRVTGVVTDDADVHDADTVLLAAGCWSAGIGGLPPGVHLPIRPVKGQLLHLRDPSGSPPFGSNLRGLDAYLVARPDGRIVVGATVEELGFDMRVRAGAVYELLRAAYEIVPGSAELELVEVAVGLRLGTPDNAPLIGDTGAEGLMVATGHFRNGILQAPATADAVKERVTAAKFPDYAAPFDPARFSGAGLGAA